MRHYILNTSAPPPASPPPEEGNNILTKHEQGSLRVIYALRALCKKHLHHDVLDCG